MKLHRNSLADFSLSWRQDHPKVIHKGSVIHEKERIINVKEIISKQKPEYDKTELKCGFLLLLK